MSDAKPAEAEVAPKKKKKLFLIVGIVLVLAIGAGAAFFLLHKKKAAEEDGDGEETTSETHKAAKAAEKSPPTFVKLEAFTVRLQTDSGDSYLQAIPELRVLDAHVGEDIKNFMPEIRHKSLLVIAAKHPADVSTPEGVQKLANELRVTINAIVKPAPDNKKKKDESAESSGDAAPDDPVQAVLFTSFIVQ